MTRTDSDEKDRILESAGYFYDFNRDIYLNRESKKIFSLEAIEDHDVAWLNTKIQENNETGGWVFNFNELPDSDVQQEIIEGLQ